MANFEVGPLYTRIGEIVAELVEGDPIGTLFLAEAGDGWSGGAIFEDKGDRIMYRDPDEELMDVVRKAWEAEDRDKRWAQMHYRILDGRFNAKMIYPEEIDPAEDDLDRRARLVKEVFGDKPIDYSAP